MIKCYEHIARAAFYGAYPALSELIAKKIGNGYSLEQTFYAIRNLTDEELLQVGIIKDQTVTIEYGNENHATYLNWVVYAAEKDDSYQTGYISDGIHEIAVASFVGTIHWYGWL